MKDLTETTVTDAVLAQIADTPDPASARSWPPQSNTCTPSREVSLKPQEWFTRSSFLPNRPGAPPFANLRTIGFDFILAHAVAGDENSRVRAHPAPLAAE